MATDPLIAARDRIIELADRIASGRATDDDWAWIDRLAAAEARDERLRSSLLASWDLSDETATAKPLATENE